LRRLVASNVSAHVYCGAAAPRGEAPCAPAR
jgi:hypothetical protein